MVRFYLVGRKTPNLLINVQNWWSSFCNDSKFIHVSRFQLFCQNSDISAKNWETWENCSISTEENTIKLHKHILPSERLSLFSFFPPKCHETVGVENQKRTKNLKIFLSTFAAISYSLYFSHSSSFCSVVTNSILKTVTSQIFFQCKTQGNTNNQQ